MKTKYEVIWIDDEWERMDAFKEECEVIHQIYLHPFPTQKAGMDEFDKNPKKWDAIILDAKLEKDGVGVTGLREAVTHINQVSLSHKIPYFISTGQPDLMGNETFEQAFGKYYIKERDDQKLIEDIKMAAGKSSRFQTKTIYHDAVEQLSSISIEASEDVIDILVAMHHPELAFTPKLHFNPLRQALESVFRAAQKVGVIPDPFFNGDRVNINQCFMYLIGSEAKNIGFRCSERIAPYYIQNMMSLIVNLGNANSHSKLSELELQTAEEKIYKEGMNSRYLVFSMALQLCEIASWMNRYIAVNPNKEENIKKCIPIDNIENNENKEVLDDSEIVGTLEEHDGICHMGTKFSVLLKHKEWLGKKIRVINYVANTSSKTKQYPFFVREQDFELIEEHKNGSE